MAKKQCPAKPKPPPGAPTGAQLADAVRDAALAPFDDPAKVIAMLQAGADPDGFRGAPLRLARELRLNRVAATLIAGGASEEKARPRDAQDELRLGAATGDLGMVRGAIAKGAALDKQTSRLAASPLYLAIWAGQTEMVGYLLDHGAKEDREFSAFGQAAGRGDVAVGRLLAERGLGPGVLQEGLRCATYSRRLEFAKFAIELGADPSLAFGPVQWAEWRAGRGDSDFVQLFREATASKKG